MKKRRPNVAKTLLNNGISALFSAIEIHNKPKIEYRYPNVVVLLLNSWELVLKSYLYKVQKRKNILKKIKNSEGQERYIGLSKCVNYTFGSDEKNKLYVNSIELLYDYRNIITHAFSDDLDSLIYSIISENILLLGKFIEENFGINIGNYEENLILLPIGVKKPFNPVDFLSNKSYIEGASNDVKDFINSIRIKGEELEKSGIKDGLLVNYSMEIIGKNKVKNADLSVKIDGNSEIGFSKETTLKITNDEGAQKMRPMNSVELRNEFNIEGYNKLRSLFQENFSKDYKVLKSIYKELKNQKNYNVLWCNDPETKKLRFNKNIISYFEEKYEKYLEKNEE